MKRTLTILIMIAVSIGLGYTYDKVMTSLEKKSHPIPALYEKIVEKYSEEYNVPEYIIYSVIKAESSFRSDVVSEAGAVGLMQITPDTFDWLMTYQLRESLASGLLFDPETNIKYGTYYLRYLYQKFDSWDIAFIAYNAGPNSEWLNNPEYIKDKEILYIPIEETRNYVKKVNKNIETYKRLYFS